MNNYCPMQKMENQFSSAKKSNESTLCLLSLMQKLRASPSRGLKVFNHPELDIHHFFKLTVQPFNSCVLLQGLGFGFIEIFLRNQPKLLLKKINVCPQSPLGGFNVFLTPLLEFKGSNNITLSNKTCVHLFPFNVPFARPFTVRRHIFESFVGLQGLKPHHPFR